MREKKEKKGGDLRKEKALNKLTVIHTPKALQPSARAINHHTTARRVLVPADIMHSQGSGIHSALQIDIEHKTRRLKRVPGIVELEAAHVVGARTDAGVREDVVYAAVL